MSWNEMFDDTSVATASATFSPRHASPAPGPSYLASPSPSPSPLHLPRQPAPLPPHQQVHDDDILPLPLPPDLEDSPGYTGDDAEEPTPQEPQQPQARQDQHHGKQGKAHKWGAASSHMTVDTDYQCVRLAVLGAPGVGKSAIVKQFVMQHFPEEYVPTEQKQVFCPAVIINDHLYEVRIIDCPYIPYFPVSSLYEWTDFRGYGLRNATAYILVYDITSEDSFQYIKNIREQILESRDMHDVPIFVVGNKHDLSEERGMPRREVAQLVKKQWKCGYIECSAKFNWHIMLLFKELMKTVDYIDHGHKPTSVRVQDALRRNRCLIL